MSFFGTVAALWVYDTFIKGKNDDHDCIEDWPRFRFVPHESESKKLDATCGHLLDIMSSREVSTELNELASSIKEFVDDGELSADEAESIIYELLYDAEQDCNNKS